MVLSALPNGVRFSLAMVLSRTILSDKYLQIIGCNLGGEWFVCSEAGILGSLVYMGGFVAGGAILIWRLCVISHEHHQTLGKKIDDWQYHRRQHASERGEDDDDIPIWIYFHDCTIENGSKYCPYTSVNGRTCRSVHHRMYASVFYALVFNIGAERPSIDTIDSMWVRYIRFSRSIP